jgi:RNA polymerase sigma-70 factor (ECF subfamily)
MAVSTLSVAHLTPHSRVCEHALPKVRRMREDLAVHEPMLRATARHLCRKAWETDDLVQDTFERALKHLEAGRPPPTQMRPWLTSILRNAFIDRIRRKAVTFETIEDPAQPETDAAPPWADVTIGEVRAALAKLDEHLRLAFELHYLQGLRYREVAKRLAIADNTVASRLFRARQALREELERSREAEGREAVAK